MSWQNADVFSAHVVMASVHPCWHCGLDTRFGHVDFQAPLHPGACTDAKWAEYDAANLTSPKIIVDHRDFDAGEPF